jgi:uncharacterized protein YndB with AHSA1/START domain
MSGHRRKVRNFRTTERSFGPLFKQKMMRIWGHVMSKRVDTASRTIRASASTIYEAFASADAMNSWLPPQGMTGTVLAFAFREGGAYRMRLTYNEPHHTHGKTSDDADEFEVRFLKLVQHKRIEQVVTFESDDPAFSGAMRIVWLFERGQNGTHVTVRCEDVPMGIAANDHQAGLTSTLANLAAFAERSA